MEAVSLSQLCGNYQSVISHLCWQFLPVSAAKIGNQLYSYKPINPLRDSPMIPDNASKFGSKHTNFQQCYSPLTFPDKNVLNVCVVYALLLFSCIPKT